jgi:hypothetical protein
VALDYRSVTQRQWCRKHHRANADVVLHRCNKSSGGGTADLDM